MTKPKPRCSVYPIVNGCSTPAVFTGTQFQCARWVKRPENAHLQGSCIILQEQ